jgi:transposase
MDGIARRVAREANRMTRKEVIVRAIAKELTWIQAADICGITARQMRRVKQRYEERGYDGLVDGRGGKTRRKRIPVETIEQLCQLRREKYAAFSVQHFWEKATEAHGLVISYTWAKLALQAAGLAEKSPARGKYRRRRERRPLRGTMLHLDGSTHAWLAEQPMWDLIVLQDDADSWIHYARFVPQEGTQSTFAAVKHVVQHAGRFCELYTDRGSHFCYTPVAGQAATTAHAGHVSRALKALGIRQILAYSPQARGRSERTFQTIQGRLPQELQAAGITTYVAANEYLERVFIPDFNRRFTVTPAQAGSAFVPLVGVELELLLSVQHERTVWNDSTVSFEGMKLQLPPRPDRAHYVRCPVLVHEFPEGELGISYQGRLLARYERAGQLLPAPAPRPVATRTAQQTGTTRAMSGRPLVAPEAAVRVASRSRGQRARPPGILAPRAAAGRSTPSAPHVGAAPHSSTRAGAAAHNVDGDTRNRHQSATKQRPSYRAVHNVDSSLCPHPARSVRARRAYNKKPTEPKTKNKRSRTERTS